MAEELNVNIPAGMRTYIAAVITRLGYLHPEVVFFEAEGAIIASCEPSSVPSRREILHQLYREKIYQDGLAMRELMYRTILA